MAEATGTVPALSLKGLSKTFPGTKALDDVELEIMPGEIRALVGQNGCGKSTLIKVLAGFHMPDDGAVIEVAGSPLNLGHANAGEEVGLRFVHQDLGLVLTLDSMDNLALGRGYHNGKSRLISWGRERTAARKALSDLGYDIDVRRLLSDLSMSERTAIAVARALSPRQAKPHLLVLDEPTANLPASEAESLFALVRTVRDAGVAVLFVSHHLEEVFELCDSVTVFRDGHHIVTRPTEGLDEPSLVELMIGKKLADVPAATEAQGGEVALTVTDLEAGRLSGLSLKVRAGEITGVAGITGSGREELAPAIFGGVNRTGEVRIGSTVVQPMQPASAVAAGLGMVPSERHTNAAFLELSLRENVSIVNHRSFTRLGAFLSRSKERSDIGEWLLRLQVHPGGTERALGTLSGGNQQKVMLARWLRQDPKVLILDEPTQGVDIGAKAEIHALVDQAAAAGMAVLVVSTDDGELARLCSRVLVLAGGRVVEELVGPGIDEDAIAFATIGAGQSEDVA